MQELKDYIENRVKYVEIEQSTSSNSESYVVRLKQAVAEGVGDYLENKGKLVSKAEVRHAIVKLKNDFSFPMISHGRFIERQGNNALYNSQRFNSATIGRNTYFYTKDNQILDLLNL